MVAQYKVLKYNRTMAYIQQIKQGNLNRARELSSKGDANVVYKLLERYSYMELLKALKKFKKERGELSHADIKDMSKVVSTTLQQSIKDKLDAKLEEL
jgi:DNA helicase HerA-like ATPase